MALLSQFIANQRYSKIEPYIRGDLLDLGFNNAQILQKHRAQITHYVGIERSPEYVATLNKKYPEARFLQRDLDCDHLNLTKKFDCILMIALIEHLFNQKFVLDEIAQSLTPGGVVVITTPTPLGNDIVHRLGGVSGAVFQIGN
jgi:SAM-dependent methyltransferase